MKTVSALAVAIQSNIPVLLWGAPGVGKTATINAIGEKMNLPVEVVIASIREPADFAGLPIISEEGVKMEPPAWAKRLYHAGKGILFLDEISTAPPAVQAALLRVVLDRVVGDLPLPQNIAIVAAANPPEIATGGWDLSAPLANRFCHLEWELNPAEWVNGMIQGWPSPSIPYLPEDWQNNIPSMKTLIASFIHHRPHLLLQLPSNEEEAGKAWPSPRSWEMAAKIYAAADAATLDEEGTAILIAGCVGEGAALEFLNWAKELDLPDPEDVLAKPSDFIVPERGDKAYAVLSAIVTAAIGNLTKERWLAAWTILARAAEQGAKDIAASSAKALAQSKKPDLPLPQKELKEFIPLLKKGGLM